MMKHSHTLSSLLKKIRAALLAKGTNISLMTISQHLSKEFGLESHKRTRKPCPTTAMKFKQLDFAKKFEDWTAERCGSFILG